MVSKLKMVRKKSEAVRFENIEPLSPEFVRDTNQEEEDATDSDQSATLYKRQGCALVRGPLRHDVWTVQYIGHPLSFNGIGGNYVQENSPISCGAENRVRIKCNPSVPLANQLKTVPYPQCAALNYGEPKRKSAADTACGWA